MFKEFKEFAMRGNVLDLAVGFIHHQIGQIVVCIALGLMVAACGPLSPSESCGAGGTADKAAFAQHFTSMELVNEATGQPGQPDQEGEPQFASSDPLAIRVESRSRVSVRACVEQRRGGGKIAHDQTHTLAQGAGSASLGSFAPGPYVVRVIVDGVLVKNLPFSTR